MLISFASIVIKSSIRTRFLSSFLEMISFYKGFKKNEKIKV